MNHSQLQERLSPYLEGDLDRAARDRVDLHIRECDECAEQLRELRSMLSRVRSLEDPEPPPRLSDDVMARIRAGEARVSWLARLGSVVTAPALSAPLAAGAVVLFALAILPLTPLGSVAPAGDTVATRAATEAPLRAGGEVPLLPEAIVVASADSADAEIQPPPRPNQSGVLNLDRASARIGSGTGHRTAAFRGESMDRGLTRIDGELDRIAASPSWFLETLEPLSDVYRESWIDRLSQRARQVNRAGEIADRVRETGHLLAPVVASRFEVGLTARARPVP